jgi:hypothetical protein
MLNRVRRALSRKVSIEAMIEVAMWLAIPYLIVGVVWSFATADDVQRIETELQARLPAAAELVAFGITTALWPVLMIAPEVCTT